MNLAAVEALRHIGQGFLMLADAVNPEATVAGEKGSHISGDPVDDQEDDEPFPQDETETEAPTLKDLQKAAKALIDAGKRSTLKKILDKHQISNLSGAEEADYPKILAELQK